MTSAVTAKRLAEHNFCYDEDETGKFNGVTWSGTIVPIAPIAEDGEQIEWRRVCGNSRKEMDAMALEVAKETMSFAYRI